MENTNKLTTKASADVEKAKEKLLSAVEKLESPWYLIKGAKNKVKEILWEIEGILDWIEEHLEET